LAGARLWDWACAAYARPGAAQACLALQDDHGQSVGLLLWAAWRGTLEAAPLAAAADLARRWEALAVGPLRQARRGLQAPAPPIDDAARAQLRETVKSVELAAERMLLEGLEALGPRELAPAPALSALGAASAAWGPPAPEPALAALAACLD
jgi:uncharacterized protein (TIGR02444 family)